MAYVNSKSTAGIGNPWIDSGYIANSGFKATGNPALNYESMPLHFQGQKGGVTWEPEAYALDDETQAAYGSKLTANYPLKGTDLAVFANLCRLAGAPTLPQLFVKNQNGEYLNLINTTNNDFVGSPDGANGVSLHGTKMVNNEGDRQIDCVFNSYLYDAQVQWLGNNGSAFKTSGAQVTGGTALNLVEITNSRALRVLPKGYHTVKWAGVDVGLLEAAGTEFELVGGPVQNNIQVIRAIKYTAKFKTKVFNLTQLKAASLNDITDGNLQMLSYAGETININGTRGMVKKFGFGNDWGYLEGTFTGQVGFNSDRTATGWDTSPDRIDFTVANTLTLTCKPQ